MDANWLKRLWYAFLALLAGDAVLLVFLLVNAVRIRAVLLAGHIGNPAMEIPTAIEGFIIYASASLIGWLFVGIPIALFLPDRSIKRLNWPVRLLMGAAFGPLALVIVFLVLSRGHLSVPASFRGTTVFWIYATAISTISFAVYTSLLRKNR